jgi:hypothetical protein
MGFFKSIKDLFSSENCPACGMPGARRSGSEIRCLNPVCQYFNPSFGSSSAPPQSSQQQPPQQAQVPPQGRPSGFSSNPGPFSEGTGSAHPGSISIQYRNFQGQNKTFYADKSSLHRKKNHIFAKVAPKGQQIALSRDRIQNVQEVERQMPQRVDPGQEWPNKRERQVLGYHKKHGTTSPLYEKIRAKYPKW